MSTRKRQVADKTKGVKRKGGGSKSRLNDHDRKRWEIELAFFKGIKTKLLGDERYRGKFIAIKDKKIIDHDADEFKLARRINGKYADQVVLIAEVRKDDTVAELRSPRVAP